jgi:hypothetical protein
MPDRRWPYQIYLSDIWKNPGLSFEEQRDAIVERLRASEWIIREGSDGGPLDRTVEELAEAYDVAEFDDVWAEVYRYAGADRTCWIDLISAIP